MGESERDLTRAGGVADRTEAGQALRERVKELRCLYGISRLVESHGGSLSDLLQGIVELLPPAWQFPDVAVARIVLEGEEHRSPGFRETAWRLAADIEMSGARAGVVEVFYLEGRPGDGEELFLPEEQELIRAVAERVARLVQRRRAEAALQRERALLDRMLDASHDTIFLFDPASGRPVRWNRRFVEVSGFGDEEIASLPAPRAYYDGDELRKAEEALGRILAEGHGTLELSLVTKQGRRIPFEYAAAVVPAEAGPPLLLSIGRSVAGRRRAEAIMQLRLRLLEFAAEHPLEELMQRALDEIEPLTDSLVSFFHLVDPDQKSLTLQAWSTRTQREFCRAEGRGLHYGLDQAGVWVDCVRERRPVIHNDYETLPHRKGLPPGHARVVRELVVPAMREGCVVAILGVGNKPTPYDERDVEVTAYVADVVWTLVERKRAQEALRRYADQLAAQNAELDTFAHTVAHDLKGPVGVLTGYGDLLAQATAGAPDGPARQYVAEIVRMGRKVNAIIDALLLLATLRKTDQIELSPVDMAAVVEAARRRLGVEPGEHAAEIVGPASWPVALGYAPWLEEVWANYLANAVKYGGRPPRVELGAEDEGGDAASGVETVRFWVRDNGKGLSPEEQARLFTPFERLGQARIKGYGLGLSIVRRIVEKLGGRVGVDSDGIPGHGSTFFFTLPKA